MIVNRNQEITVDLHKIEYQNQLITGKQNPSLSGVFFQIYQTDDKRYFIKQYTGPDIVSNRMMSEQFIEGVQKLGPAHNLQQFYTRLDVILLLLIQSYEDDLTSLIEKNFFATHFDLLYFIHQFCSQLLLLFEKGLVGFVFQGSQVVMNRKKEFLLSHFDLKIDPQNM